jgi:hypothetical protein
MQAGELSRSFELRYVTADEGANGETDFKGTTSIFSTEQRLEFLNHYEKFAGEFFADQNWDTRIVSDDDVRQALRQLKSQPMPEVRRRLSLTDWKYLGSRPGQRDEEIRSLTAWRALPGVKIDSDELVLSGAEPGFEKAFAPQSWRFQLQWRVLSPAAGQQVLFDLDGVAKVGIDSNGQYFFRSGADEQRVGTCSTGRWHELKVEVDLESGRYNFLADNTLLADFVPLVANHPVGKLTMRGPAGVRFDDLWGVGYAKAYDPNGDDHTRDVPFTIHTFLDQHFQVRPDPADWASPAYNDRDWLPVPTWPYAHGGERRAGETLYLRTRVRVDQFERAELSGECLDPSGEIWINGRPVEVRRDRHPFAIDVTSHLKPGVENLLAVRVDPFQVTRTMRHTPADLHTGWFAGRMHLDLTAQRWIKDVFVYTESLAAGTAAMKVRVLIRNDQVVLPHEREPKGENAFRGRVSISFRPWFPNAGPAAAVATFPIVLELGRDLAWEGNVTLDHPALWSPESPQLYKVTVRLEDAEGAPIDDSIVTTGIRTVSQTGGTFRVNGQPAMMNGGLIFGFRPPLERIAQWLRCPPEESLVREVLTLKRMNGNTLRMSHHDGPTGGVNDPRYAEIGDQLGVMFQWATPAWVRTDSPYLLDFEGLPRYLRQVRNHPSIVMWQPANHPKFTNGFEEGMLWFKKVYDTIAAEDLSRLIAPTANIGRLGARNDDGTLDRNGKPVQPIPVWTAPMIVRGDMDHSTGYGAEWTELRKHPFPSKWEGEQGWRERGYKTDYLASKQRAYFDFESEESASQPNWTLHRGKPQYQVRSYEIDMDRTSIGRRLTVDEWRLSQAWQAMSGYEAYRKKRWLDYDGMVWCTLDGGGNTATYEKPLTDYYGFAKIAYHTVKMAFQPVLAGSKNVDVAYGPADKIPVAVFNLGPTRTVEVTVTVRTAQGAEVARKVFSSLTLPAGRTCTDLPALQLQFPADGFHVFEYRVTESKQARGWPAESELRTVQIPQRNAADASIVLKPAGMKSWSFLTENDAVAGNLTDGPFALEVMLIGRMNCETKGEEIDEYEQKTFY